MEASFTNASIPHAPKASVVAKIGPFGIEWKRPTTRTVEPKDVSAPTRDDCTSSVDFNDRKTRAVQDFLVEQQRRKYAGSEAKVLSEIARRRGPGSLHHDLGLD